MTRSHVHKKFESIQDKFPPHLDITKVVTSRHFTAVLDVQGRLYVIENTV